MMLHTPKPKNSEEEEDYVDGSNRQEPRQWCCRHHHCLRRQRKQQQYLSCCECYRDRPIHSRYHHWRQLSVRNLLVGDVASTNGVREEHRRRLHHQLGGCRPSSYLLPVLLAILTISIVTSSTNFISTVDAWSGLNYVGSRCSRHGGGNWGGRMTTTSRPSSSLLDSMPFCQQQRQPSRNELLLSFSQLYLSSSSALSEAENDDGDKSSSSPSSTLSLKDAIQDTLDKDDQRNVPSLKTWATTTHNVKFATGVQLIDNGFGDWGVGIVSTAAAAARRSQSSPNDDDVEDMEQEESQISTAFSKGTPIMTIPHELILSSSDPDLFTYHDGKLYETIVSSMKESNMEYYTPECLLITLLLWETSKGSDSPWYPYIQTLPKSYTTGIYMDEVEKSHLKRFAFEFVKQQEYQYNSCKQTILHDAYASDVLPTTLQNLLQAMKEKKKIEKVTNAESKKNDDGGEDILLFDSTDDLFKWAFSVVFTRSWRTPARDLEEGNSSLLPEATLVPLGDMFNHDSMKSNVAPSILDDGSVQLSLKSDIEIMNGESDDDAASISSSLYLSYGLFYQPARYLVMFGFWDRSNLYMDANLTIPTELSNCMDPSSLIVSTNNGGVTQDVFNLAIYHFLLAQNADDGDDAQRFLVALQSQDESTIHELSTRYELEGALYLRLHVLKIISDVYPEMDIAPSDDTAQVSSSPRRYGMIARYNNGMRDSWLRVLDYLDEEIEDLLKLRGT